MISHKSMVASWTARAPRVASWTSAAALVLGHSRSTFHLAAKGRDWLSSVGAYLPATISPLSCPSVFLWPFSVLLSQPPNTPKPVSPCPPPPPSHPPSQEYDRWVFLCRRSYASDAADHSYPASPNHPAQLLAPASHLAQAEHKEGVLAAAPPPGARLPPGTGSRQPAEQPQPPPAAPRAAAARGHPQWAKTSLSQGLRVGLQPASSLLLEGCPGEGGLGGALTPPPPHFWADGVGRAAVV